MTAPAGPAETTGSVGTAGAAPSEPAIRLRSASVTLPTAEGPREILRDVDFEVKAGEIVAIVGRSGTGKTTLLRLLGGLLEPTTGSIEVDGRPISGPVMTVVTVFQDYARALLPWRSVARNVALPLEGKVERDEREKRVAEAVTRVRLAGREKDYPGRLSGGMQQRVQLARAFATRPRVLLMDEPFGALDALTKAELQDELLEECAEPGGPTVVFITHDIDEALYLSDRVLVIADSPGRITLELATTLPRPRHQLKTRELPEYLEIRHRLAERLGGSVAGEHE